jgi:tetratricopeptide (TPR) repeat protein
MVLSSVIRNLLIAAASVAAAHAAESAPVRIVLQNGKSLPVTAVALQGDKLVATAAAEGFKDKQLLPPVSHVFGDKPAEINQALAMLLFDREKAKEVQKLLEPVVKEHQVTAKISGNYWIEAAKILMLAYALDYDNGSCTTLGRELSDATPAQGTDPMIALCRAVMVSPLASLEERDAALRGQMTDELPADVCAYASFFRGDLFVKEKKPALALDSYLKVSCLYPSGGRVLIAASEIRAADLLSAGGKRDEALALVNSAMRGATGTTLVEEVNKRLESLK